MTAAADSEHSLPRVDVTVLLPVHEGVSPEHLRLAMRSIREQSTRCTEFLVVEDGPLTAAHYEVIDDAKRRDPSLQRLRLPVNGGIAAALQAGLERATCPWVARMDADDVAAPYRLAIQSSVAATDAYDVIGSAMLEFESDPTEPTALRAGPLEHDQILREMRRSNPVNHPTVMFRRSAVLDAGGYRSLAGLEDYDLWARLASRGANFINVADPLVFFRVDDGLFRRRRGRAFVLAEIEMQRRLIGYGLIGRTRAAVNAAVRIGFRLLPPPLMRIAYAALRRRTSGLAREPR
jgi:glycosyltransferase involved in cell wall biosynthesis